MTEPAVTLTDYALAVECGIFVYLLVRRRSSPVAQRFWFSVFFASIAFAALVGGTVHGFFESPSFIGERILWPLTMIAIGVTSLSGISAAAAMAFQPKVAAAVSRVAFVAFLLYCLIVLFSSSRFLVAIVGYLPAILFLAWAFIHAYRRTRQSAFLAGFIGVCITLAASWVQQAKIGINPRYFNHNALYHLLEGVGLFMIFIAARAQDQVAQEQ